jgi:hypothetical protein
VTGKHPDKARVFGEAMTSISGTENPAVAAAYDFSKVGTLVDVGGSHGHMLAAILKANRSSWPRATSAAPFPRAPMPTS